MNELFSLLLAEMTTAQLVFLCGLIILVGILLARSRRHFSQRARAARNAAASTSASVPRPGHHIDKPSEMQRWEVEMDELARELAARLDSKMLALEHLIREADAVTARLRTALDTAESARQEFVAPAMPSTGRRGGSEVSHPPDTFHAAYAPAAAPTDDPRYRSIYALADQGLSRDVIARRVGTPAGEVDLILSLRGKK